MSYVSTKEYSEQTGLSEATVRRRCSSGQLPHKVEMIKNKKTYKVFLEDDRSKSNDQNFTAPIFDRPSLYDAEIVSDQVEYPLISMEKESFDQMIAQLKNMADDRADEINKSYDRLMNDYLEMKAENKELKEQVDKYRIEAIQFQAENKILQLRLEEKDNVIDGLNAQLKEKELLISASEESNHKWWSKKL